MQRSPSMAPLAEPEATPRRPVDLLVMLDLVLFLVSLLLGIRDAPGRTGSTILILFGGGLFFGGAVGRLWLRRHRVLAHLAAVGGLAAGAVCVAAGFAVAATPAPAGAGPGGPVVPLVSIADTTLTPCGLAVMCNDKDKLDLDTGCPGWGDIDVKLGPHRCGELADLVIEDDHIHSASTGRRLLLLDSPASPDDPTVCAAAFAQHADRAAVRLDRSALRAGGQVCVRTDKDNLSMVTVVQPDSVGNALVVRAITWLAS